MATDETCPLVFFKVHIDQSNVVTRGVLSHYANQPSGDCTSVGEGVLTRFKVGLGALDDICCLL